MLFAAEAYARPCITNLDPRKGGISLETFRSHSANLSECEAKGKEKEVEALRKYLKGLFVIGVPGYNNEKPPFDYMASLQRFVDGNGGKFLPVRTQSDLPVNFDAERMCGNFRNVQGKRVVMIGHSKGGATALYMFAKCPALMNQMEAVFLVNAVVQGTAAADIAVEGNAATQELAKKLLQYKTLAKMVGTASGGASLTTRASQARLTEVAGKVNLGKTVCVVSRASAAELGDRMFDLKEAARAFGNTPNDGLVAEAGQTDPRACGHNIRMTGVHHKALIERDGAEPGVPNEAREAFAAFLLNTARLLNRK